MSKLITNTPLFYKRYSASLRRVSPLSVPASVVIFLVLAVFSSAGVVAVLGGGMPLSSTDCKAGNVHTHFSKYKTSSSDSDVGVEGLSSCESEEENELREYRSCVYSTVARNQEFIATTIHPKHIKNSNNHIFITILKTVVIQV